MGNLAGFANVKTIDRLDVERFIELGATRNRIFGINGETCHFDLYNEKDFLSAYNLCSPLKSIIAKRAKAFNSGSLKIINENTGKEVKSGLAAQLSALLDKPNALQSGQQFFAQQNHYVDIFGYCPVFKIFAAGFEDVPSSMWNIPPWLFDIEFTNKWLMQSDASQIYKSFFIYWMDKRIELTSQNVYFVFDDGIGTQFDINHVIPDSRLIGMDYIVSNIIAAYKSRNTLITKRGAIGILSNQGTDGDSGSVALKPGEKEALQKDFQKYGLTGQPFQVIITDANLNWQQMGFPTKDLMLFEEVEDDIKRLCDAYGMPKVLMATNSDTTFDNQNQGRKDFIQNTIIPESDSRIEQNTEGLLPEDSGLCLYVDFTALAILQEDAVQAGIARFRMDQGLQIEYNNGLITKNMWLEAIGEEKNADPAFDEYYTNQANA